MAEAGRDDTANTSALAESRLIGSSCSSVPGSSLAAEAIIAASAARCLPASLPAELVAACSVSSLVLSERSRPELAARGTGSGTGSSAQKEGPASVAITASCGPSLRPDAEVSPSCWSRASAGSNSSSDCAASACAAAAAVVESSTGVREPVLAAKPPSTAADARAPALAAVSLCVRCAAGCVTGASLAGA